jgi:cysteine synthase
MIEKKMPDVFDQSEKEPEFDWLQLHNEIHTQVHEETTQEKLMRKLKDNPFVPIGIYTIST